MNDEVRVCYDYKIKPMINDVIDLDHTIEGSESFDLEDTYLVENFLHVFQVPDNKKNELIYKVTQELGENKYSFKNYFEIRMSLHCDNDCVHCFIAKRPKDSNSSYEEMTKMIDDADERVIGLSGGEPTIHPDFLRILKYIKSVRKRCSVQSHGRQFSNEEFTKEVAPFIDQVMIPIHSYDNDIHDSITQVKGSAVETWKGIENLRKYGVRVITQTVVNKKNLKGLLKIGNRVQETMPGVRMVFTFPQAVGSAESVEVVPTYTEVYPYLQQLLRHWARHIHTHYFPPCQLFPYTDIVTCIDLVEFKVPIPGMDILDGKWKKIDYGKYNNQSIRSPVCNNCIFSDDCYGIPKGYCELGYSLDLWPIEKFHYSIRNRIREDCVAHDISFMDRGLPVDDKVRTKPVLGSLTAPELFYKYLHRGVQTELDTSEFHSEVFKKILESTYTIEITSRCNYKCTHCYVPEYVKKDFTLSMKEIQEEIDSIDMIKYPILKVTGGEPTIHPNFIDVVKYASNKGFHVHVNTNGSRFSDNDFLEDAIVAGMEAVSVSVLSADIDKFNDSIGNTSSKLSWEAWGNLSKTDLILMPQLVLTKLLYPSLMETLDRIQSTAPGTRMFILGVKPVGRATDIVMSDYEELRVPLKLAIDKWGKFMTLEDVPLCYFDYDKVLLEDYDRKNTHENYDECDDCIVKDRCFGFPTQYKQWYKPTPKAYK